MNPVIRQMEQANEAIKRAGRMLLRSHPQMASRLNAIADDWLRLIIDLDKLFAEDAKSKRRKP